MNYLNSKQNAFKGKIDISPVLALLLISVVVVALAISPAIASASNCATSGSSARSAYHNGDIQLAGGVSGSSYSAIVRNNTSCALPVSLASYKMFDRTLEGQQLFASSSVVYVAPGATQSLSVGIPDCMAQIDLFYGAASSYMSQGVIDYSIIEGTFNMNQGGDWDTASGAFCVTPVPTPTPTPTPPSPPRPPATASCYASPSSVATGQNVSWVGSFSNISSPFTYSWAGTDGLAGSTQSLVKVYSNAGTKYATFVVSGLDRSVTANCSVTVIAPEPTLTASCSANPSSVNVGDSITWNSTVSGGTGSYTYSWTGSDSLFGSNSSILKTYSSAGLKTATVTVISGSQSTTANCSATVIALTPNLTASCYASPNPVNTNQTVNFNSSVSGGTGAYTYSWSNACTGSNQNCSNTFSAPGTQTATVTVISGSQTATANCPVVVNQPTSSLTVSCSANPSAIQTGQSSTFTSNVSGGVGSYVYSWSGACSGSSSTCSNTFYNSGSQIASLTVTSGAQTASTNCPVSVSTNPIVVSCYASPSSITSGQSATFISNVSGGTGSYTYLWSGACSGSSSTCSNSFYSQGNQTATITVTSGSQSNSANCVVNVSQSCTPNYQQRCIGNSMYWFDSCGAQGIYVGPCGVTNASLNITKTVRNLATGTGFANSTYANPSDTVMFMITVQNTSGQDAQNVVVRDVLPANLIYNNQLVVARSNNAYNNFSGDIISGINLNTIPTSQTVTITFQAQVASATNFAFGTTTLNNVANATSSNVGYIPQANASVVVTRATVLGASTVSTGLTNNFWVDSFILPFLITLIGLWMWRAGMFFGIEKWFDNKKKVRRTYKAERELSARIAQLQKLGK